MIALPPQPDLDLASLVRTIPDFPKPGIQFRDITTLIGDAAGHHPDPTALGRVAVGVVEHVDQDLGQAIAVALDPEAAVGEPQGQRLLLERDGELAELLMRRHIAASRRNIEHKLTELEQKGN